MPTTRRGAERLLAELSQTSGAPGLAIETLVADLLAPAEQLRA